METSTLSRLISRLHKHATLMSAASSSKGDEEKEDRTLSEKRLSLSNGCFRIGDAIEWLQKQDVCIGAKNTYREAWRQIVLMTEAGGIAPVLAKDNLYDAKTWYYFTQDAINLGPINFQLIGEHCDDKKKGSEVPHKVQILDDEVPYSGIIMGIKFVMQSSPSIRQKWAVVIYDRVSRKDDYHLSMARANDKDRNENAKMRSKKRSFKTTVKKRFREHLRVPIKLPDRIIPRTLIKISLNEPIPVKRGQYVGIICHSNETLRFSEMDTYHSIALLRKLFQNEESTRAKRVDGNIRVYGAEKIYSQNIYCIPCYRAERQSRANVRVLEILGGSEYHLSEHQRTTLSRYSNELAHTGKYKDVQKLLQNIVSTFKSLEDMNPSSKLSFLHMVKEDSSFEYNWKSNSISIERATLYWYLPDETDLELVKYFFVYSASSSSVRTIARYASENNMNLDPNNESNADLNLNFIACVEQGQRDIDSQNPPSHYAMELSNERLPPGHDHIIIYAVCDPSRASEVHLSGGLSSTPWSNVPANIRGRVHIRRFMQDTPPATLRLRPFYLNRERVASIVEDLTVDILNVIDETVPPQWLRWGKHNDSVDNDDENVRIRKRFTVSGLLRHVFISTARTLDTRGELVSSPLFDDDNDDPFDEMSNGDYDVRNAFADTAKFVRCLLQLFSNICILSHHHKRTQVQRMIVLSYRLVFDDVLDDDVSGLSKRHRMSLSRQSMSSDEPVKTFQNCVLPFPKSKMFSDLSKDMAAMKTTNITPENAWFSFVDELCHVIVHTIQIEVRSCAPMVSHLIEALESRILSDEESIEINSSDLNTQKQLLHDRLRTFALTIRKSILSSVGDTDRVVDWVLRDAPKAGFNELCSMVTSLMSRVARDRDSRYEMAITSLRTWCDDVDMLTALWQVNVEGLRCLDVPVLMQVNSSRRSSENDVMISTKNSDKSKIRKAESKRSSSASSLDMGMSRKLSSTDASSEGDLERDYSSDEEVLGDDYDDGEEDEEDEEDKNVQFHGNDKKYAKTIKVRALKSLRRMVIPIAKMHAQTCCVKCKKHLQHEVAYNVSEDHQKTQKFKGIPSFAVDFRTVFRDVKLGSGYDHPDVSSAEYGKTNDGYDDDLDKEDEVAKLNRDTERRREDRIERRRRAIENDSTVRINELILLNEMSQSMMSALYTNGCVQTIQGVGRSVYLNDVMEWLCGVEVEMYATVKLSKSDTQRYVVVNITKEGTYALKPDAQRSSLQLESNIVKLRGTDLKGVLRSDLVDLCGRVRVLMEEGNLRAFHPAVLEYSSASSEKKYEDENSCDLDWEKEEEEESEPLKSDRIIYVNVNEIEAVVAHPRFPSDVLCSICRSVPSSTFRPYCTRSDEIRKNVQEWIEVEMSESQAEKWSKYYQIGQDDKETLRSALRVAARAEEEMLKKFTACERCEAEAEAHVTDVDFHDGTLSAFRTRIGIPGFTRYISTYLTKQKHVIRSKASKRAVTSRISHFTNSALCYPSWLREQFGRLDSELKLIRSFIGKKIEKLEEQKERYVISNNVFQCKVADLEQHCAWNFPCQRRLQEDSFARQKRIAAKLKSESLKRAVKRLGITSSSSTGKRGGTKQNDDIHIPETEKASIEYREDYSEYLLNRRKLLERSWIRLSEDHAMMLVKAMQKYNMIRIFSTEKDECVQITPLNSEEIRRGMFGDKASDVFDQITEIFPDVEKAFANKTFAKICDQLRSDIFATHLQSLHLNDTSWVQLIGEAFRFLLVGHYDEDECLAKLYKRISCAAITRLNVRQAVRSREERTTTSVTLCHFGEKTEDIDDGKNEEEQKDGQQNNTDGVKTVTARYHYESFEVQLKAHCVNQNVRFSICPELPRADVLDCLRNLRKQTIKSEERKMPRQTFTKIKYEEEDDHLIHLLDHNEDEVVEHDLHGVMNSDVYRRAPDRLNIVERLRESISLGDARLLRRLVKEFVNPTYYGNEWYLRCLEPTNLDSLLHYAAEIGRNRIVRCLIFKLKHSTVGIENLSGDCPIHVACRTGNVEIASALIDAPDANIHIRQRQEYTPLHIASLYGHVNVVRLLLNHGAHVTHHTLGGYTPLDLAIENGHTLVAQVLRDHIAATSSNVESGDTTHGVVVGRVNGKLLYSS